MDAGPFDDVCESAVSVLGPWWVKVLEGMLIGRYWSNGLWVETGEAA